MLVSGDLSSAISFDQDHQVFLGHWDSHYWKEEGVLTL